VTSKERKRIQDHTIRKVLISLTESAAERAYVHKCELMTGTDIGEWICIPGHLTRKVWKAVRLRYAEETRWDDPLSVAVEMIETGIITEIAHDIVNRAETKILHLIAQDAIARIKENHELASRLSPLYRNPTYRYFVKRSLETVNAVLSAQTG